MLNSPIEQFFLIPLFNICSGISNFSFFCVIIWITCLILYTIKINYRNLDFNILFFVLYFKNKTKKFKIYILKNYFLVPTYMQYIIEIFFINIISALKNLINLSYLFIYFYQIILIILIILLSNTIGLIPYTFTITAQIFFTLNLSLLIFIIFNIMGFLKYGINLLNLIIPTGITVPLHFLLIPIELISYIFKPISLAIRLFANIMAGHTLLKVICGFIYKFFNIELFILLTLIPISIIIILFGLECFVALIQSYVFFILINLSLKDILILNH